MAPLIIPVKTTVNAVGAEGAYYYIAHTLAMLFFTVPGPGVSLSLFVEGSHETPLRESSIKSLKFAASILIPGALESYFCSATSACSSLHMYNSAQAVGTLRLLAVSSLLSVIPSIYSSILIVQKKIKMLNYVNFALLWLMLGSRISASFEVWNNWMGYAWYYCMHWCLIVVGDGGNDGYRSSALQETLEDIKNGVQEGTRAPIDGSLDLLIWTGIFQLATACPPFNFLELDQVSHLTAPLHHSPAYQRRSSQSLPYPRK